eukprot:m.1025219 g.1025219  ORF g.1025219 m.1025219 type:complete len:50 (+) comp24103_c0_seq16:3145-3294(+)
MTPDAAIITKPSKHCEYTLVVQRITENTNDMKTPTLPVHHELRRLATRQ